MNMPRRPTPEEMLARAEAEEATSKRGQLKIFFGAAPGVGKTYAMLEAARARRKEGIDVVIGCVDTHGRKETAALAEGLERLPPQVVDYRGLRVEEFDLDGALRRRPGLILVDELAHTNVRGSRHTRRWQEVQDLLDARIDVYTTLNVQHLESLNDVVAQITGIVVRETVPDSIFEQASEVELVDLTPDDLLQRLKEGKVYIPVQAQRAIENFFKKGNLIALRELALRRTAERVDVQMATWKRAQGLAEPWPTHERILVAIGSAPQSADLVRAACRMARRLQAPWIALSVETPVLQRLSPEDRDRIADHLSLAEQLGGDSQVVAAEDTAEGILTVARQRNVSRILIGKPRRRRWSDHWKGSLIDRLARASGPIDVMVTTGEAHQEMRRAKGRPREPATLREYALAVATVIGCTALCLAGWPFLTLADLAMIYLLGVLLVASRYSRGSAVLASLASVAAFDFFFVPPFFTFAVSDIRYTITFAVLLVTGLLVSTLTLRIRQQADAARQREQRTAVLYMMSRSFAFRSGVADIAEAAARHVEVLLETEATVLMADPEGRLIHRGGSAGVLVHSDREMAVARWVMEHARPAGFGTDTLPGSNGLFLPLVGRQGAMGVLGIALASRPESLAPSQRQLLDVFVNQIALALERALMAEQAEKAQVSAETERLRSALLSSVSHDFRTPLAAVTGAATSLLEEGDRLESEARRELLETIREESQRLGRIVNDLLDITRIESGSVQVRKEWYPLEEVIGSALTRLEPELAGREVKVDLPSEVLQAPLDPVLADQLFFNLLENAIKYTPSGSPIEIYGREEGEEVVVEVRDRGPGLPPGEEKRIFERFYRVPERSHVGGTGLGLAVSQAVVKAHGGRLTAANREGGGAIFRCTFPLEGSPPTLEDGLLAMN